MADTVDALKCWVEQKALKKTPWKKKSIGANQKRMLSAKNRLIL